MKLKKPAAAIAPSTPKTLIALKKRRGHGGCGAPLAFGLLLGGGIPANIGLAFHSGDRHLDRSLKRGSLYGDASPYTQRFQWRHAGVVEMTAQFAGCNDNQSGQRFLDGSVPRLLRHVAPCETAGGGTRPLSAGKDQNPSRGVGRSPT
jgi:hypothetical protein